MGTAALAGQHVSRRHQRLLLPVPREESRKSITSNVLGFRKKGRTGRRPRRRFPLALVLPIAGLLLVMGVVPAVGTLSERHPENGFPLAAPRTADAMAGYLISEPIHEAASAGQLPQMLKVGTYRVRPGESLAGIAQKYGLSVDALISFNNIKRARSVSAGSELRVPNADGLAYTVRRGDTLRGIAARHGVSLESLLDWNALESDVINAGQALFVPGGRLPASVRDAVLGKLMVFPTRGELSSRFGWRDNPFTGLREHHNGLDIGAPMGTPVVAAMSGRVAITGVSPVYGRYVILSHASGLQTLYGHLNRALVARGAAVSQGQPIGEVGNTGYSTGSHLHFTVFRNNVPVDPLRFFQ